MADTFARTIDRIFVDPRITMTLVGIGAAAVIFGLSQWGATPNSVPVALGLPLEKMSQAAQRLDEAGIEWDYARGGSAIVVPESSAAEARVALAAEGLAGAGTGVGFELFDQPSWGMTDFTQRVNYRRALEGELERTIRQMNGVEAARVHLALQRSSFLRGESEANQASIVLQLRPGTEAAGGMVEGVQALVSGSVEGLASESVMVLDDRGRLLSTPDREGVGESSVQLKARREVEEYLERRAEALLHQIVGAGAASVRVAADLNFDQFERTVQGVDPDQQLLVAEDRAEITPGNEEQGAGSVTTNSLFESTRSLETLTREGARVERLTVAVLIGNREVTNPDGTTATQGWTAQELQEVQALVANAVGLSPNRGDQITVVNRPFTQPSIDLAADEPDDAVDVAAIAMAAQRPVISLFGIGMAFLLATRLMKTLALSGGRRQAALGAAGEGGGSASLPAADHPNETAAPPAAGPAQLAPPAPAPAVQVTDPAMTARVLRSWLKDS